jgi:hypothetical protein
MFEIVSTYICLNNIYKMQHLEGSSTLVLYIGRTVLKGSNLEFSRPMFEKYSKHQVS